MERKVYCPYCGSKALLVRGTLVNPMYKTGYMYVCDKYPDCDSYIRCHKKTLIPLGTLANKELRELRVKAHSVFDKQWLAAPDPKKARLDAYKKLAEKMNLTIHTAHIGMLNEDQCRMVIQLFGDQHAEIN